MSTSNFWYIIYYTVPLISNKLNLVKICSHFRCKNISFRNLALRGGGIFLLSCMVFFTSLLWLDGWSFYDNSLVLEKMYLQRCTVQPSGRWARHRHEQNSVNLSDMHACVWTKCRLTPENNWRDHAVPAFLPARQFPSLQSFADKLSRRGIKKTRKQKSQNQ